MALPPTYEDFSVSIDEDGAATTFADGILTFGTASEYTVSMADSKTSTSNRIVVNAADVTLNLDGVVINAPQGAMYTAGGNALTVTSGTTLNVIANSSLTGGVGGSEAWILPPPGTKGLVSLGM